MDFTEIGWDGLVWIARFRIGTGGGLLWARQWNYELHKMWKFE
jgi:hypothetical protein